MIARATRKQVSSRVATPVLATFRTELGWMAVELCGERLVRLSFGHPSASAAAKALGVSKIAGEIDARQQRVIDRLTAFAAGQRDELLKIDVDYGVTTPFQKRVLDACRAIPAGETLSYAQLAQLAGAPGAARAVGSVMRKNRVPLVVPCHRVVSSNGLGGYSAAEGLSVKRRLLEREGVALRG